LNGKGNFWALPHPALANNADLPMVPAPQLLPDIVQRDDGMWSIGWHDDAPRPFESRQHAADVARKEVLSAPPSPESKRPGARGSDQGHSQIISNQVSTPAAPYTASVEVCAS